MRIVARILYYTKTPRPWPTQLQEELAPIESKVIADDVGRGCWDTARRCWQDGLATEASHILVLADDALPCEHFAEVLYQAIATRPNHIVNLCSCAADVQRFAKPAFDSGKCWIDMNLGWLSGVAVLMPREIAIDLLAWGEKNLTDDCWNDEAAVAMFACDTDRLISVANPSLIQHNIDIPATYVQERPIRQGQAGEIRPRGTAAYHFEHNIDHVVWTEEGAPWTTSPRHGLAGAHRRFLRQDSPARQRWGIE